MKKITTILLKTIAVSLLLILPDILFSLANSSFHLSRDIKALLLILPLSTGLVLNKYKSISYILITLITILQLSQFFHVSYFESLLSPYSLVLFEGEIADVMAESVSVMKQYWYIFPFVIIPFFLISLFVKKNKTTSIIGTIILTVTFLVTGQKLFFSELNRFSPNEIRFSIDNSLKSFWGCMAIHLRKQKIEPYLPYEVIDKHKEFGQEPINIIYIIGESCNYKHMSLFGYNVDTTPILKEMSKDPTFYKTEAISGAISTLPSCKFITNVLKEANNPKQAAKTDTNLFKFAKSRGFKTFYISSQTEHMLGSIGGIQYMDVCLTKDSYPHESDTYMDEHLLSVIDEQTFSKRNFIVLHQRCIHSPYDKTFSQNYTNRNVFKNKNKIIESYDNAMFYNDYLISSFFKKFNKLPGKYYIIFVSDHNELMNENGQYGHGHRLLKKEVGNVPLIIQTNDTAYLNKIKSIHSPTQYEISSSIAELLGFDVINPNAQNNNEYFISGLDYNGKCGFIKTMK